MPDPQDATTGLSPLKRALLALDEMKARLETLERAKNEPIAVVGMGCRFPDANGPDAFWRLLRDGVDTVREVPKTRWDADAYFDPDPTAPGKTYSRWGAFLDAVDRFDPQFFGIAPREAAGLDPQQRLLLEVTWEALENAAIAADRLSGTPTGVFVGICSLDYAVLQLQSLDLAQFDAYSMSGSSHSIAAGRLSYILGLQGPSIAIDTACSSSLVAVHLACQSLRNAECRVALAAGVHTILSPLNSIHFSRLRMLAADGRCKTFDARGDGFVEGEGCGVVVLKRFSDALADGDRVLAVIRGSSINQDGASSSLTAPNGPSQEAVIRAALQQAGIRPAEVAYVEAHGTGTALGDPIEVQALAAVFGEGRPKGRPLLIGSVKTNIGHTVGAAGIAGLIKLILALDRGEIPPSLHFREPNPFIPWSELPVSVVAAPVPWPRENARRVGGVSSFGFSGTNVHVVVEEPPRVERPRATVDRPAHVLALSARTAPALGELAGSWAEHLATESDASLADVAYTANAGRAHFAHRLALVLESREEARALLAAAAAGEPLPRSVRTGVCGPDRPKVAFLFTGQGAQFAGMGRELYATQPTFRRALDRCAELLSESLDRPLLSILYPGPGETSPIDDTGYAQPALFAFECALAELWRSWGVVPAAVLGHSLGEYVAACVAGVLKLEDAARLVAERARLMHRLPRKGAMAAVFADEGRVRAVVDADARRLSIAAFNAPDNIVISGSEEAVAGALRTFETAGITYERLTVSHAFHSPLMDPILDEFERFAAGVPCESPRLPLISNLTGRRVRGEIAQGGYWRRHLREPVRFAQGLAALHGLGCRVFVEIGPKPTLTGLGRRASLDASVWVPSVTRTKGDWRPLLEAVAELYARGIDLDWKAFDGDYPRGRVAMPTYPFQRQRYWIVDHARDTRRGAGDRKRATMDGSHPLLGRRLSSPLKDVQFESEISTGSPAFLADHCKNGVPIFPATASLELGLAAAREVLGHGTHVVQDLAIVEPLVIGAEPTRLQVVVSANHAETASFQIHSSQPAAGGSSESWRLHGIGSIRVEQRPPRVESEPLEALQERCREPVAVERHYSKLAAKGHQYGPSFQGIVQLWRGENEALARIRLPEVVTAEVGSYHAHPALVDAGMQLIEACAPDQAVTDAPDTWLPVSLGRFRLRRPAGIGGWSHVRLRPFDAENVFVDVRLYDDEGQPVAEVDDMCLRRMADVPAQARGANLVADWLHEVVWRVEPLAAAGAISAPEAGCWLVFADRNGIGPQLAKYLKERGDRVVTITPGPAYACHDVSAIVDPDEPEHYVRLLQDLATPVRGVVHLWSVDGASEPIDVAFDRSARLGCGSVLHLVQALVGREAARQPRLWIVTQGAQSLGRRVPDAAVHQALVWGLARTIGAEHPELKCTCIDLDPEVPTGEAHRLWAEIAGNSREDHVAFREGRRHVARLVRAALPTASSLSAVPETVALEIGKRGVIDHLELRKVDRRAPGPGEVEIRVSAAGLNFRDVLNALGTYQGEPGPLGAECVGEVVRVGPDVTTVKVGDTVFGMAAGALRTFVTTLAGLVIPKPPNLSDEDAATIPATFLTAEYALNRLARVQPGERVLIHAAAGGVGLSAVQLAQRAGAEIFATAGSSEKQAFLRSLGVQHVFSSRSIAFAEQILALTGGEGVDIVLNSLAGEFIENSVATLRSGGRFLEIGRSGIWTAERMAAARPDVAYFPIYLGDVDPALVQTMLRDLADRFTAGTLQPLPRRVFALSEAVDAFRHMAQAKHIGKIVFRIGPAAGGSAIRSDATYLVTGGLGALGLRVAQGLVDAGARHLLLAGRSAPSEQARQAIETLETRGARVTVAQADVSREADVARLLSDIDARMPPLSGIIHAAGVLDDGVLIEQSWPRFERVLAPKAVGAWHLHRLTEDRHLDFLVFFSSMVTLLGSPGQGNYAAASAFLDALAGLRRARGLPALSIAWGIWADSGMVARVSERDRRRWHAEGFESITPEQGVAWLNRLIRASPRPVQLAVLPIDWPTLLQRFDPGAEPPILASIVAASRAGRRDASAPPPRQSLVHELASAAPGKRRGLVQARLRAEVIRVLGLDPTAAVDARQPLRELGLDSLMAVELRNVIGEALERTLPATLLFKYPTLEALCDFVLSQVPGAEPAAAMATGAVSSSDADDTATELEPLSDEEARRLLAEELQSLGASWTDEA